MTKNDLNYWKQTLNEVVPKELVTYEVVALRDQQNKMLNLMAKKNADYGNAFNLGCNDLGVKYGLARIYDKAKRVIKLIGDEFNGYNNPNVKDESMLDTIQDLGNYCNMILAWKALDGDELHIPSTGRDTKSNSNNNYWCIADVISGGGSILVSEKDKNVTTEICNSYNLNNLYTDEKGYIFSLNADDNYVAVTDSHKDLVIIMSKSLYNSKHR